ncbi:hypothetical protein ES703_108254 [subsurface metagenome]
MNCNKYHSIIPSFSLPGTSLGTFEVEDFIKNREDGRSRVIAGKKLVDEGISIKHLKYIEKMIHRSRLRMNAFFPEAKEAFSKNHDWYRALLNTQNISNLFYQLNTFCLHRNTNAVFCNRFNILIFQKSKPGTIFSNNMGSITDSGIYIDSS